MHKSNDIDLSVDWHLSACIDVLYEHLYFSSLNQIVQMLGERRKRKGSSKPQSGLKAL